MEKHDNAARRLFEILQEAHGIPNIASGEAWHKILMDDGKPDKPELLRRLSKVMELPKQIQEEVLAIEDINSHEVYLRWMPDVANGFATLNFEQTFNSFRNHIKEQTILGVEICSELLSRHSNEPALKNDELANLYADIMELWDRVSDSEIDTYTKQYILKRLEEIRAAIDYYRFSGTKQFKQAIESTVGSYIIDRDAHKSFENHQLSKDFWKIIGRAALMLTVANGLLELPENIKGLLPEAVITEIESSTEVESEE